MICILNSPFEKCEALVREVELDTTAAHEQAAAVVAPSGSAAATTVASDSFHLANSPCLHTWHCIKKKPNNMWWEPVLHKIYPITSVRLPQPPCPVSTRRPDARSA
jgi:hypothetical protein